MQEEARLRSTDPSKERARLEALVDKVGALAAHVSRLSSALSDETVEKATGTLRSAIELRAAASVASSGTFTDQHPWKAKDVGRASRSLSD